MNENHKVSPGQRLLIHRAFQAVRESNTPDAMKLTVSVALLLAAIPGLPIEIAVRAGFGAGRLITRKLSGGK